MTVFEASNGVPVRRAAGGYLTFSHEFGLDLGTFTGITVSQEQALREFFRHERDEELGRWRWPENPDFVVYAEDDGVHNVVNEDTGLSLMATRGGVKYHDDEHADAARAYFKAHQEPEIFKWSTAQVITWKNGAYLPQMAQRDLGSMNLGWWYGTGCGDESWYSTDSLAKVIDDAEVSILVPEEAS